MVRRITIDEAAANFKDIVERAMANGDSVEFERDGRVLGTFRPTLPKPVGKRASLRQLFESLDRLSPVDESFADDLQTAVDRQRVGVPENRWED